MGKIQLTKNDILKIQEEINYRKVTLRPELLNNLKTARAQGDLSENFEYTMAKRINNQNNGRIRYLENMIKNAQIIEDTSKEDEVGLEKKVTIYIPEDDCEEEYKLVTSIRGNSLEGRISTESPLGKALFGKKVGDHCIVEVNADYSYEVIIRKIEDASNDNQDAIRQY